MKENKNLSLQIALLEYSLGLQPSLPKAAAMLSNPSTREKTLQRLVKGYKEEEREGLLKRLREEKVAQKLFGIKRDLKRLLKKAKVFAIRRIIKSEDKADLERVKGIDLDALCEQVFESRIKSDGCGKEGADLSEGILENGSIKKNIDQLVKQASELRPTIFHSTPFKLPERKLETRKPEKRKAGVRDTEEKQFPKKPRTTVRSMESSFMTSLSSKSQDVAKKNRMGQRARRALAERIHGENAKHLSEKKAQARNHSKKFPAKRSGEKKEQTSLHPSWEAKKQEKERLKKISFEGSKIRFEGEE